MRFLFSIVVVIFIGLNANQLLAQTLRVGVHAGPTTTDFYDINHPLSENFWGIPTLGATFGTVGLLSLGSWAQVQLEQNVSWEGNQGHFWNDKNVNLWYLATPLIMKFKIYPDFWIGGGVEGNFLFDVTGPSEVYKGSYWNGAAIFQVEHHFLKHFACTIRYLHGFTPTSIIHYVNYEGQNATLSTYSGRRLHVSLSYFFYQYKMQPKWVEGEAYFY